LNHKDFKDTASFLFGEKFGTMAKECMEAAEVLKKTIRKATLRKLSLCTESGSKA